MSNNRTKRAMRPEKKWVALVGYEPVLEDPMPKASDGFLHKVEVQGTGRCLDGSWPVYYYAYGSEPTKWVIDLEGGDWCTRFEGGMDKEERGKDYRRDCFERRDQGGLQGGTTKDDKETLSLDWLGKEAHYFSNSTKRNPLMHGWNKVFIRNCDGSSFTSGRPEAWTGITDDSDDDDDNNFIYTQGKLILDSVLQDLLIHRHLGHADEVVLAGCSAGGLAVILHLDSVAETIRRTAAQLWRPDPKAIKVRGLADSGFFLDEACGGSDKNYRARMKFLYDYHFSHNGLNPKCTAHYNATGEFYKCLFAENALRFLETPVFLAQSLLDGWALTWIGCDNENEFKTKMKNKLAEAVSIPENGGFMDSCRHHWYGSPWTKCPSRQAGDPAPLAAASRPSPQASPPCLAATLPPDRTEWACCPTATATRPSRSEVQTTSMPSSPGTRAVRHASGSPRSARRSSAAPSARRRTGDAFGTVVERIGGGACAWPRHTHRSHLLNGRAPVNDNAMEQQCCRIWGSAGQCSPVIVSALASSVVLRMD